MKARGLWTRVSTLEKGTAWGGESPTFHGFDLESRPQSAQHRQQNCHLSGLKKQRTKFISTTSAGKGGMRAGGEAQRGTAPDPVRRPLPNLC